MRKLLEGILDFRAKRAAGYELLFKQLAKRQNPDALFITCSDSRVVPNLLASTNPGDLFVMRNVGNAVPPCCAHSGHSQTDDSEIAALEYAVQFLRVKDIIVCGHSDCGAIQAICSQTGMDAAPHLKNWLDFNRLALEKFSTDLEFAKAWSAQDQISQKNVLLQLTHLMTYPLVKKAAAQNQIQLHGWWFDIEGVDVYAYNPDEKKFNIIDEAEAVKIRARLINS
ncbi:carbonic anhydrase [candidate division FCPU426 bacterium]|nr:carbonic anhydrase [candidate division FCPU426 bacterium]